ncbi:MAG: hypothetical protein IAG13_24115 [Deltaproteobacteria bacterium]|nr:hypothetical protein [Nannocystaceae bacterium]
MTTLQTSIKVILAACALLSACTRYRLPPLSPLVASLPGRLSETGLFADASNVHVATGVRPYAPSYELWSDGAVKRRWISIPPGARIDTSDMDAWQLPVGTRLWKEFSRDGRRIETRLFARLDAGPGGGDDWAAVAYLWNAEQTDAVAVPAGIRDPISAHEVPSARACMTCHGGRDHAVLGFSAVQLAYPATQPDELDLVRLIGEGWLTHAPAALPTIGGTAVEVAALGWLHANCGSCHNAARPDDRPWYRPRSALELWLTVDALPPSSVQRSALTRFVVPGVPERSAIYRRASGSSSCRRPMPPLATTTVDRQGLSAIAAWISAMPPTRSRP